MFQAVPTAALDVARGTPRHQQETLFLGDDDLGHGSLFGALSTPGSGGASAQFIQRVSGSADFVVAASASPRALPRTGGHGTVAFLQPTPPGSSKLGPGGGAGYRRAVSQGDALGAGALLPDIHAGTQDPVGGPGPSPKQQGAHQPCGAFVLRNVGCGGPEHVHVPTRGLRRAQRQPPRRRAVLLPAHPAHGPHRAALFL